MRWSHLPWKCLQSTVPVASLTFARRELPDKDIRRAALDRLRSLLVLDLAATRLGTSIQQIANRTSSPGLIEQSVRDCFRAKASSTLQTRAGSLWRLSAAATWHPPTLELLLQGILVQIHITSNTPTSPRYDHGQAQRYELRSPIQEP